MNGFGLLTYDDYCARLDGPVVVDEDADYWAALLDAAVENANGEIEMGTTTAEGVDADDLHSAVFANAAALGVELVEEPPTVEQIDALPTAAQREHSRRVDAQLALSFMSRDSLIVLLGELFARLTDEQATALILTRVHRLDDEHIGIIATQAIGLLDQKLENERAVADAARERQRGAECAIAKALGRYATANLAELSR